MGKVICDSTTSSPVIPWRDPTSAPSLDTIKTVDLANQATTTAAWEDVTGLEDQQKRHLRRLHAKGVLWKHPEDDSSSSPMRSMVFRLTHGGDVEADGNCLFTASQKATGSMTSATDLRRRTVKRFLEDLGSVSGLPRDGIDEAIKHMYSPDLKSGWGIHLVQEIKLLAKKEDREALDSATNELVHFGMQRTSHFSGPQEN